MRILAIDTTTEICSVALLKNRIIYKHFEKCSQNHAKYILPSINRILNQGCITLNKLDALAFCRGPGSFNGVRISVSIAQGLALGASLPMISISTLATIAQGAWREMGVSRVITMIDARMNKVYWAEYIRNKYGVWHGEETESVIKINVANERLKNIIGKWSIAGTGLENYPWITKSSITLSRSNNTLLPNAEDMLPIACYMLESGCTLSVEEAVPIYLYNKIV